MDSQTLIIIINSIMLAIFIIIIILTRKYLEEQEVRIRKEEKEKSINKVLDKYFEDDSVKKEKDKLEQIEKLRKEIEGSIQKEATAKTSKAEKVMKSNLAESSMIEQGGKMFSSFSMNLKSAMPRTEQEKTKDMTDLMDAVKALEGLDQEEYFDEKKKSDDMGKGLFFDRISSKLYRYMRTSGLRKEPLFVYDKLIHYALENIKNIKRQDVIDALFYMKEAGYVKNYVKINPQLILVVNRKEPLEFTNPEKVVLSFVQDNEVLTMQKLMELAQWSENYAKDVVDGLIEKEIASVDDDVITIEGFETREDKQKRLKLEKELEEKRRAKAEEKEKEQAKLRAELQATQQQEPDVSADSAEETLKEISKAQDTDAEAKKQIEDAEQAAKAQAIKKFKLPSVKTLPSAKPLPPKADAPHKEKDVSPKPKMPKPKKSVKIIDKKPVNVPKPPKEVDLEEEDLIGIDEKMKEEITRHKKLEKDAEEQISGDTSEKESEEELMESFEDAVAGLDAIEPGEPEKKVNAETSESGGTKKGKTGDSDLDDLDFEGLVGSEFVGEDMDEELSEEAIIDGILSIYEKYEHINGGLMDLRLVHRLLQQLYPDVTVQEMNDTLPALKDMGLVQDVVELDDLTLWLFKDITLSKEMKTVLTILNKEGWLDKAKIADKTGWDEEKVLNVMKALQDMDVLRLDGENNIIIPGLYKEN